MVDISVFLRPLLEKLLMDSFDRLLAGFLASYNGKEVQQQELDAWLTERFSNYVAALPVEVDNVDILWDRARQLGWLQETTIDNGMPLWKVEVPTEMLMSQTPTPSSPSITAPTPEATDDDFYFETRD